MVADHREEILMQNLVLKQNFFLHIIIVKNKTIVEQKLQKKTIQISYMFKKFALAFLCGGFLLLVVTFDHS